MTNGAILDTVRDRMDVPYYVAMGIVVVIIGFYFFRPRAPLPPGMDAMDLVKAGRRHDAMRLHREQTGASLGEAKAYVEALERGENPPKRP